MTNNEVKERLPHWLGGTRIGVGLAQGVALYWLSQQDHTTVPAWLVAAWSTAWFVPILVIGGLGAVRGLTLAIWTAIAIMIAAGLPYYGIVRLAGDRASDADSAIFYLVVPILLFVGHHLIAAGDEARRWIAPYERYFDLGWRHGAQLLLAGLFTGAFWAVLWLGAALFNLIGIKFLADLAREEWFGFPATCIVFAAAVHLTDMRSGLVRGARALGLVLLSWLLPAMTVLAAAFFVALPFTSLEPLWATRAATAILLSAAATLVVLINAAYQDGVTAPNLILRWSARVASVLMTPLAALAAYALYMRIEQYGLTPERIYAVALLVIGACYAVAYAIGAFWPRWMKPLEIGNLASAAVVMVVAISLFSPMSDPARLSVNDQMRRLASGRVSAEEFDVVSLRFDGARYGRAALEQLQGDRSSEASRALAERATAALAAESRWQFMEGDQTAQPMIIVMRSHDGAEPEGFRDALAARRLEGSCSEAAHPCAGYLLDLDSDGADEFLVRAQMYLYVFGRNRASDWVHVGMTRVPDSAVAGLERGELRLVPARVKDVMIGDTRVSIPYQDGLRRDVDAWPPVLSADED